MDDKIIKEEEYTNQGSFSFETDPSKESDIIASLAKILNTTKEDLIIHSRKQHLVRNRDLVMYILREYGEMSYPAIGKLMGGRDHTTVIHAYRKIKEKIKTEDNKDINITELINRAKGIKEQKDYIANVLMPSIVDSVKKASNLQNLKPKEISERNMKILELYREGLTLNDIGDINGLTRERVRQVVGKTIHQIAINESLQKGIILDADILLEEEKKSRTKKRTKEVAPPKIKEKRWSHLYLSCKSCHSTGHPHVRNGLCEKCLGRYRGDRRENIISSHKNECDFCAMSRSDAIKNYGRDFYITKEKQVFCKKCFLENTGKSLGSYKHYEWSRFYPECISCGTTSIIHSDAGLCKNCSARVSPENRETTIVSHGEKCDDCKISRKEVINNFEHDLFITKEKKVLCMKCHLKINRKKYKEGALSGKERA